MLHKDLPIFTQHVVKNKGDISRWILTLSCAMTRGLQQITDWEMRSTEHLLNADEDQRRTRRSSQKFGQTEMVVQSVSIVCPLLGAARIPIDNLAL